VNWGISERSSAVALAALLAGAPAAAQLCTGLPFERGPLQVLGRAAALQGVRAVGAGVAVGVPAAFAHVGVSRTTARNLDRAGTEFRGTAGVAFLGGPQHILRTCFIGSAAYSAGPNDVIVTDAFGTQRRADVSGRELSLGVAFGTARSITRGPLVFPTAGASIVVATSLARVRATQDMASQSRVFALLETGFGVVVGDMFSFRPMLTIPVGLPQSSYGGSVTFSTSLGRRSRSARF
jgi:hypothetical protein